jgi:outer membrane protein OmpU
MNNFKKVGLTALGTSLIATSAFAAAFDVTGGASITFAGQENTTKGNGFTMNDEVTFSGSGEMDNGWNVTVSMQLDDNANGSTAGDNLDNRSIAIDMGENGKLTFYGHGGSDAYSLIDDVMPHADGNESWDIIAAADAGTAKFTSIGGATGEGSFMYAVSPSIVDGLALNVSYVPSQAAGTTTAESTTAFSVAYTGYDGLTLGYGQGGDGAIGSAQVDAKGMYAKYAYGPVTVGYQKNEQDSDTAGSNDEFTAYGISYALNDDFTISYNQSIYDDSGTTASDQENSAVAFSYTMGSMKLVGTMASMDNVGGSTATLDDVQGYEVGVSFAF